MPLVKRQVKRLVLKSLRRCIEDVLVNVSGMYHGCIMNVITLYLSCITDVLEVVPYPPVFLHTLAITSLRPSPSGHPVFGISSPWALLLGPRGWGQPWHGSARHAFWQAGHAHSSMPSWVPCSRNHSWAGIQMGPLQSRLQT